MLINPTDVPKSEERETISHQLFKTLEKDVQYKVQLYRILEENSADISTDFLGFMQAYHHLSLFIPTDRVIYDMGCAHAFQAYYFRFHRAYVGVDLLTKVKNRLSTPNASHLLMSIEEFVTNHKIDKLHFAICNYVPPWGSGSEVFVRKHFEHLFVYYPCSVLKGIKVLPETKRG